MSPEAASASGALRSGEVSTTALPDAISLPPFAIVAGDLVQTGGMDRANLALAIHLSRQDREVHVVAHRADGELLKGKRVVFHRVPKPANSYLLAAPLLERAGRRVGAEVAAAGGRVLVNGGNCAFGDINWVHYVHAAYKPTHGASSLRRIKGNLVHRTFLRDEKRCLMAARTVIANSNLTRKHLIELVGVPAERIRTVYYGNDSLAFSPASDEARLEIRNRLQWPATRPIAVFIGALGDRRKGFDTLFAAWSKLCGASGWDANLIVVGRGAELNAWQSRAVAAQMGDRIQFLGFRRDVPDILRAADVLVAPTRYEAYGLGVQEALCCGIPALVSAASGVAERFPDDLKSLLLTDSEDSDQLASRLLQWRASADSIRRSVQTLCTQLTMRSWDQMAKEIVNRAKI